MRHAAQGRFIRSFKWHLRSQNRSERIIATYVVGRRSADAFPRGHGTAIQSASRADLEVFSPSAPLP